VALHVELVSPERVLYSGEADTVVARTVGGGDIAFLVGHAPFLGALQIAGIQIHETDGDVKHVAVHGGFVEVSNDKVTILSDTAEVAEDIDVDRARRAHERARKAAEDAEDTAAEAQLRRAHVRLAVAGHQPEGV
jgi:F-type H+-transporting ATPase subunit epsilon